MIKVDRNYRYVIQDRDRHGNLRTYLRRRQAEGALIEALGTDAFDAEYRRAIAAEPKRKKGGGVVTPGPSRRLWWPTTEVPTSSGWIPALGRSGADPSKKLIAAHGHRLANQMTAAHV
jgi:hypothetical protein